MSGPTSSSPSRVSRALDLAPIVAAQSQIAANSAEQNVFQHRQSGDEAELLFDDRDAGRLRLPGARQRDRRSFDQDLSLIGRNDASERFDERALACAIMTNQGVNLAPAQ